MKQNIVLIFATFVIGIIVLDAIGNALNLCPKELTETFYWRTNPRSLELKHEVSPHLSVTYHLNDQGLREKENITTEHPDTYRIILIGDSFTFGWAVEDDETIPYYLEQILKQTPKWKDVEVINMGVPGVNPQLFLRFVIQYACQLNPDLVMVNIFAIRNTVLNAGQSTLEDATEKAFCAWVQQAEQPDVDLQVLHPILDSIWWNSFWVRLFYRATLPEEEKFDVHYYNVSWPGPQNTIYKSSQTRKGKQKTEESDSVMDPKELEKQLKETGLADPDYRSRLNQDSARFFDHAKETGRIGSAIRGLHGFTPRMIHDLIMQADYLPSAMLLRPEKYQQYDIDVQLTIMLLEKMAEAVEKVDGKFVTAFLPLECHMPTSDLEREYRSLLKEESASRVLINRFMQLCKERGITCFNGFDSSVMQWGHEQKSVFDIVIPGDGHFTPAANQAFAKAMADYIVHNVPRD